MNTCHLMTCAGSFLLLASTETQAQTTYTETPGSHSTLATGMVIPHFVPGDSIAGTLGTSGERDVWRLSLPSAAPGIYRVRINNPDANITPILLGASQTNGTINPFNENSSLQGGLGHRAYNQFYTFGQPTTAFVRVATNAPRAYTLTMTSEPVASITGPTIDIGQAASAPLTISTVGLTSVDTDLWVYDADFNPIPGYGNDDAPLGGGVTASTRQSLLTRAFAPGTYYLAASGYNLAVPLASPTDDRFRSAAVVNTPGILARGNDLSTVSTTNPFGVSIGGQTVMTQFGAPFDVAFIRFTVVPNPAAISLASLPMLLCLRRQRR